MTQPNVVIIGIDGATYDLISPWVSEGKLPNFQHILSNGVTSELQTTYPPVTAPAWTSFLTGCNPGKHGVFDFLTPDLESDAVVDSRSVKVPLLHELLDQQEKSFGAVNFPLTYPPAEVDGHLICGTLSSSNPRECCCPSDLIERLEKKTGLEWWNRRVSKFSSSKPLKFFEEQIKYNESIMEFSLQMLEDYQYDVFMTLISLVDSISHFFWHYMDKNHPHYEDREEEYSSAIFRAYQKVDSFLGEVREKISPETNLILASDHGFGPIESMVNLNNFFMNEGLLKLKKSPSSSLKKLLRSAGLNPATVMRWAEKIGLDYLALTLPKGLRNKIIGTMGNFSDIDRSNSVCYSRGHMGQVHLVDRFKNNEDKYYKMRAEVAGMLRNNLTHPETGEQLVSEILFKEDIYQGPYLDRAPDIFLIMQDFECIAYPLFSGGNKLVIPHIQKGRYANHRMNGIFCGYGPAFEGKKEIDEAQIVDLAPTILNLTGLPPADHMDGRVLTGGLLTAGEVEATDVYNSAGDDIEDKKTSGTSEEAVDRLKGLGYLE